MSIGLVPVKGKLEATFFCTLCGLQIVDVRYAVAAWTENDNRPDASRVTVSHLHEGSCWNSFRRALALKETARRTPLLDHLEQLVDNARTAPSPDPRRRPYVT